MSAFKNSVALSDDLLTKARKIAKGATLADSGIAEIWVEYYAQIAERSDPSRCFGLSRYPYEAGPAVN